jgi:hypothetical protein
MWTHLKNLCPKKSARTWPIFDMFMATRAKNMAMVANFWAWLVLMTVLDHFQSLEEHKILHGQVDGFQHQQQHLGLGQGQKQGHEHLHGHHDAPKEQGLGQSDATKSANIFFQPYMLDRAKLLQGVKKSHVQAHQDLPGSSQQGHGSEVIIFLH